MSKLLLSYRVVAHNKDDLMQGVIERYRDFMGDSEAALPQNTVIQVSENEETFAVNDSTNPVAITWEACVSISHQNTRN